MKVLKIVLLSLVLFSGCSSDTEDLENVVSRSLLVYLAGDNNLSDEVRAKSEALLSGWQPQMGELFVFGDKQRNKSPFLMKAVRRNGVMAYDTLKFYSNSNSASKELLSEVIADFRKNAVAAANKKYGLILFSHATGWLPEKAYDNIGEWGEINDESNLTRSIFDDGSAQMDIQDLADAIPDDSFDFIVADMCFMAGIEVAYALRNKTPFLLASSAEILSPGFTPTYRKGLYGLYRPAPALEEFALSFFNSFDVLSGVYKSATISLIKTSELKGLSEAVRKYHTRFKPEMLSEIQAFDRRRNRPKLFYDFGDYLYACAQNNEERQEIESLLKKAVVFKRNTQRLIDIDIRRHSGMTVYLPQRQLAKLNKAYEKTEWFRDTFVGRSVSNHP